MPYIKKERREELDSTIDSLITCLRDIEPVKGDLNYTVSRLVLGALKPDTGWSYQALSDAIGALQDAADEIKRRLLGPHEDKCIDRNGDVAELINRRSYTNG